MAELSVVVWKWAHPGYRSTFTGWHVNRLASMVRRHYPDPHRFICVTNDRTGIEPGIEVIFDREDFAGVPSPHGRNNPSCYRRLRLFHPDAAQWFGERFVSIDLDVVAVRDLRPLWNRPEDFVAYRDPLYPQQYNGSMVLLRAGARPRLWTEFDPARSPHLVKDLGFRGSDQAWISHRAPGAPTWSTADGVYSYRKDIIPSSGRLPDAARLVIFHGKNDPWGDPQQLAWVREHYR